ncbi:NAD(P)-binding protein [Phanerochaete sordida]|uniref:NAD(P)-binding protein n=1 Tax=Phanerochaete sordida TaxID=48140 RepID=A0A9P3LJZ2_9APHY|nr:NAD(P)-binding protein [Phanerochaete sordida]
MPAVTKGKVLVTGCNGFVALWVVKQLLEDGYAVRGTVRRESATPYVKDLFKSYGDRFEVMIVPDITKEHAFDEVVKGIDAIEHLASPFYLTADDPQEIIGPAVAGTVGILQSALAHANDTVRRVVITSSCAAVLTDDPDLSKSRTFDETHWNEHAMRDVAERGRAASQPSKYQASKTLAERAAWDFDVVALNPPFIYGPWLHEVKTAEQLNTSMLAFYNTVIKGTKTPEQLAREGQSWVDVRDIAVAHSRALQREEAGDERIIVSSGPWNWQDFVNAARKVEPSLPAGNTAYSSETAVYHTCFDNGKSKRLLGMDYRTMDEATRDIIAQFREKGWL